MGARAATIWFTDVAEPKGILAIASRPDEAASREVAERVLGQPAAGQMVSLATAADPRPGHVYVGAFGGLTVVSHEFLQVGRPSELDESWWNLVPAKRAFLLVTEPAAATGAFANRVDGVVRRSFAAHPLDIVEDEGLPELFEGPFWGGEHPLTYAEGVEPDPRALPFHPMEFAEQANRELLGFRYTHPLAATDLDPERIGVYDFVAASQSDQQPAAQRAADSSAADADKDGADADQDRSENSERGRVRAWLGF